MSLLRTSVATRIFVGLFITAGIFTYYLNSHPKISLNMDQSTTSPLPGITVSLKQKSTSPPTISVMVSNKNAEPVTFLSYSSPLDELALQLGLFTIVSDGGRTPVDIPVVEIQRKWPPDSNSFITIAPGEGRQQDVVLKEVIVSPESVGSKATVQLNGKWQAVWGKAKESISKESLQKAGIAEDAYSGDFVSNKLDIVIA
ncbi:hypothetical protein BGZ63DRAFT_440188 [Mariannaea sp. PMI_226]|nr:hypothetical protein BGZ63DRAFT_440188 [Mariannaea sp. PMI_226]